MVVPSGISDIYNLDFDSMESMDGFGKRSVENLRSAIDRSKAKPLSRLIFALGIKYVGETTAKILSRSDKSHRSDRSDRNDDYRLEEEDIFSY